MLFRARPYTHGKIMTSNRILLDSLNNRHRYHVMIKPLGARCNLACNYCYYLHKTTLLKQEKAPHASPAIMDDATLERFIQQYIATNEHDQVVFSWQGGEPTLLGIDFFEKVVQLQHKYNTTGKSIANTLQTNGTLLTEAWAAFLKKEDFLVGLSVDGPEEEHNRYRVDKHGLGTFARVMQSVQYLKAYDVPFTTLTTVNRYNAQKPLEVYNFLTQELGSTYVQFNPCVEPHSFATTAPHHWPSQSLPNTTTAQNFVTAWSVLPDDWGLFLCTIFDQWLTRDLGRVLVNWFETAVAQTMRLPAQLCTTGQLCGKGVALEYDGSVYSCDHYVNKEFYLGNINEKELAALVFSPKQQDFAFKKQTHLAEDCLHCPHGTLCWGQCPRHRFVRSAKGDAELNYLCAGFKQFYTHAKPALQRIAHLCAQE